MKEKFKEYLKSKGYKEFTPKNLPSTVFDYCNRIDYIKWIENYNSWNDIVINIDKLLQEYGESGIKEHLGKKSHSAVINALIRFKEFLIYYDFK